MVFGGEYVEDDGSVVGGYGGCGGVEFYVAEGGAGGGPGPENGGGGEGDGGVGGEEGFGGGVVGEGGGE